MNINELRAAHESTRKESYDALARIINEQKVDAGVAVGIAFGGCPEAILDTTSISELVGVDPYEPGQQIDGLKAATPSDFENLFWYAMGRLSRFGPRYHHIRGYSAQAAGILNVELDFVIVNGAQDVGLWYPKLRAGGLIAGYGPDPTGHQFVATRDLSNIWWATKPK